MFASIVHDGVEGSNTVTITRLVFSLFMVIYCVHVHGRCLLVYIRPSLNTFAVT